MKKIDIEIWTYYGLAQFFGIKGGDPSWAEGKRTASDFGATFIRIASNEGENYKITLFICEEFVQVPNSFYQSEIILDDGGLEIADVEESIPSGEDGIVGVRYKTSWTGVSVLNFSSNFDLVLDEEGILCPRDLIVYLMPQLK